LEQGEKGWLFATTFKLGDIGMIESPHITTLTSLSAYDPHNHPLFLLIHTRQKLVALAIF
jgi:hypothetical protein